MEFVRTLYYRGIVDVLCTGPTRVIMYIWIVWVPVHPAAGTRYPKDIERARVCCKGYSIGTEYLAKQRRSSHMTCHAITNRAIVIW